jgi:outer membrane protein assembly factor BamD (BamD/ComL family)
MVLLVLFALMLPANAMLLAVSNDLGESISPPKLWALMHGIGVPYLGLCGCLLLLSSGSGALLGLLMPLLPRALVSVVGGFVGAYFIIVMFRLMGYALYQYHDVLGLSVDVGFERQARQDDPATQRRSLGAAMLREGRYDEAIAQLRSELTENPAEATAHQRLHRLLLAVPGQEQAMLAHAGEWLPALLRSGKQSQAMDVIEAIWQQQPDYRPALATHFLPLAEAFMAVRRYDSAARLVKGFDRRFPGHADTAAVYLLGARLLIEHHRDEAQARRVLAALGQHFPASPAAAEALRLMDLLDRLAGAATPAA